MAAANLKYNAVYVFDNSMLGYNGSCCYGFLSFFRRGFFDRCCETDQQTFYWGCRAVQAASDMPGRGTD